MAAATVDIAKLRKFGFVVGGVFTALPRDLRACATSTTCRSTCRRSPGRRCSSARWCGRAALAPVERGWSLLAHALGWVNTRILLALVFFVVLAPVALVMRAFGKDPLERRRDRRRPTYWRTRETAEPDRLTRPY